MHGNKITYYGKSILQAYIPSLIRGHNILKAINEIDSSIIFDIEETDEEVLFKFKYVDSDKIIPLLKPRTSGANISPFSTRNLPKNKDYEIMYERKRELLNDKRIITYVVKCVKCGKEKNKNFDMRGSVWKL